MLSVLYGEFQNFLFPSCTDRQKLLQAETLLYSSKISVSLTLKQQTTITEVADIQMRDYRKKKREADIKLLNQIHKSQHKKIERRNGR